MTNQEFSNEFDILLNSFSNVTDEGRTDPIALDEYEKSLFLTKALEEIVIELYNGKNLSGLSFENTEELRRYLSPLIKTEELEESEGTYNKVSDNSKFFNLPKDDLLFITYESVRFEDSTLECSGTDNNITVVPITQDEYHRVKKNPFRGANNRRVLRLDYNDSVIEVISKYKIKSYLIKYLSKPSPIILVQLEDGLTINNLTNGECKLHPILHRIILDRAVRLALASKSINVG